MTTPETADAGHALRLQLTLDAPRQAIWRCWTEPDLLKQWFCPRPWTVSHAELDVRPGGRQRIVMRGPDGDEMPNEGVYLELVPGRRIVATDAFTRAWLPSASPFMTLVLDLDDAPGGGTLYDARALHWRAEDRQRHLEMGFEAGWTQAARQLEALAHTLPPSHLAFNAKVRTCLWFEKGGEEAAEFYTSLLPDSHIEATYRPDASAPPLVVEFTLAGTPYMVLNGGPHFTLSPAASISVLTRDQAETDRLWQALTENGGAESQCGWLTDRFGVSWQITPEPLVRLLNAPDRAAAGRAWEAMMTMRKIDITTLEAAARG